MSFTWDDQFEETTVTDESEALVAPSSFPAFPYPKPYTIQTQFMQQLFDCIEQRKVGIFESPTGTGKSLSMICGAVSWLMENERAEKEKVEQDLQNQDDRSKRLDGGTGPSKSNDDTPDWVLQHHATSGAAVQKQEQEARRKLLEERVQKIRDREKKMRENMVRKHKRQAAGVNAIGGGFRPGSGSAKKQKGDGPDDDMDDGAFLVDEYDSDDSSRKGSKMSRAGGNEYGNVSKEVMELLKSFDAKETSHGTKKGFRIDNDEEEEPDVLKIFYCSRTHSQLSQFVDELRKTSYGEHIHVVTLGSRKSLCINDKFRQLASSKPPRSSNPTTTQEPSVNVNKLNDACLDAQKSGTPSAQRCEFLPRPSAPGTTSKKLGGHLGDNSDMSVFTYQAWRDQQEGMAMDGDEKLLEFRDHALARVRDIEELTELGTELSTCPYYGARHTVRHCQLVTLPYNLLLHASTRDSLKLVIKNNILLLDEAHNLINSLLQMHSVSLTFQNIVLAQEQLQVYLNRYETRLSTTNEGYIRVLVRILKALEGFVTKWRAGPSSRLENTPPQQSFPQPTSRAPRPADRVMKVNEFLHDAGMDHINLFKAQAYLETSGVARKLQGLHESIQRKEAKRLAKEEGVHSGGVKIHAGGYSKTHQRITLLPSDVPLKAGSLAPMSTTPVLLTVNAFLMSLLNADNDGRVIIAVEDDTPSQGNEEEDEESTAIRPAKQPVLKFMLLNPANVFKPLVDEARSVVLAGGTMEPVSDLLSHLFPYLKEGSVADATAASLYPRIHRFSCGHVIPKENLMTLVVEKAPTGTPIELNFTQRNLDQVMDGVGNTLVNLLNVIPDGVVVFFVSYAYMAQVLARWRTKPTTTLTTNTIMDRIQARKRVFVEPREATEADRMLKEYHDCIHSRAEHDMSTTGGHLGTPSTCRGAVLFSVVGGKMSEGINFSDRLGRGVIMVGMPFPNKGSAELQERMRYMDQVQQQELQERQEKQKHSQQPRSSTSQNQGFGASGPLRMTAGSEYYENLCMRAVNQSIGRAIRHQGDYAVIILLDKRYGVPRIRKKLPRWIGSSIEVCEQFGPVMGKLGGFFRTKRELATAARA